MNWLHHVVWGGISQTLYQIIYIAAPFFLLGLLLHWLERKVQGRLSSRFGWKSVLWTGWLGTPIHELSHAGMCLVFRHKIKEVALFRPDPNSGCLGYVKHSYNPNSYYQIIGGFFIGTAPFLGGSLVLYGLLWLFDPQVAGSALLDDRLASALTRGNLVSVVKALWSQSFGLLSSLVTLKHLATIPFWFFLYLVLCIGSHVGPSSADYKGSWKGGLVLLAVVLVFNVLFLALGGKQGGVTAALVSVLGPVLALFVLCAILCGLTTLIVLSLIGPRRR